jgi:hypothetical protein
MLASRRGAAPEFEESLGQTVDARENALERGMISVLHQHVAAFGWPCLVTVVAESAGT